MMDFWKIQIASGLDCCLKRTKAEKCWKLNCLVTLWYVMWHTKVTNVIFDITNTNLEKSSERPPMRGKLQNQSLTSDLTMP